MNNIYDKKYYQGHKENTKKRSFRKYGITLEEYNKIFEKQNGCCAICRQHQSELKKKLAIDRNHNTGEVRGLLCDNCNHGLGMFHTDNGIDLLKKAIKYLEG